MACCSEYQTNCLKVVTIGYLKGIIKDGSTYLIQNSNGSGVDVNLNALPAAKRDDTYCPTYSELTGGSLIPNWSTGSTPNGDRDGIYVNPTSAVGTGYSSDQVVVQKDLQVKYTRFSSLSISATKTTGFSECGDSTTVSYTHKYVRYTKAMNDSCNIPSSPSSSEVSDTTCSELSWHTTYGSVSNCTTYTIPKNGSISANSRTDSVYASVVFRGSTKNSNTLSMTQNALTGAYNTEVSGSYRKDRTGLSCTYSPSSLKVYGTNSGEQCTVNATVSVVGTGTYDEYRTYAWKENNCDVVHWDVTQERKVTAGATESAGSDSYTFNYSTGCCDTSSTSTKSLSLTYGSKSCSATFSAICESCECSHCDCSLVVLDPVSPSAHDASDKKPVAKYSSADCGGSWSIELVSGDGDIFSDFEFASDGYLYASNTRNPNLGSRSATYRARIDTCEKTITLVQQGYNQPASCADIILDGMRLNAPASGRREHDSSRITDNGRFGVWIFYDNSLTESVINSREELDTYAYSHTPTEEYYSSSKEDSAGPITTDFHTSASGATNTNKCVTAKLQWQAANARGEAGDADFPGCVMAGCGYSDYNPGPCQCGHCDELGTFYDPNDPNICYVEYALSANSSSTKRLVYIFWYPSDGLADPHTCPSARVAFLQEGA
jgi:hypothetical protein